MVDEDLISRLIAKKLFDSVFPQHDLQLATEPDTVLQFLVNSLSAPASLPDIILADLDACMKNNWSLLDQLDHFFLSAKPIPVHVLVVLPFANETRKLESNSIIASWQLKPLSREWLAQLTREPATFGS